MTKRKLIEAIQRRNNETPPVWFMRQAGRYHAHYQALRKRYSFMDLCRLPEVACEVTMGPIQDFDFDAAILFSDLLFPLDALGMGLSYPEGPALSWHLESAADVKRLRTAGASLASEFEFQAQATQLIRNRLPDEKALIGFVGGPLTLYVYAVEGTHKGDLSSSKAGLTDGRYEGFVAKLQDLLAEEMSMQAAAGADAVAMFDTAAGELTPEQYREFAVPAIKTVLDKFRVKHPNTPVIYYSKHTGESHWKALKGLPFQCMGVDWNHDLSQVLSQWTSERSVQGNIDPDWLFLESGELERRVRGVFEKVKALPPEARAAWVCGLGHGVLPKTPEASVKLVIRLLREMFQ